MTPRSRGPLPTADDLPGPASSAAGTSGSAAPVSPAAQRRKRGGRRKLWVVLIGGTIVVACLAGIVSLFGRVSGREFAPSHFQTRSFSFVEIPLLRIQITPVRRIAESSRLAAYLRTTAKIPRPQGQQPAHWHLVELSRGGVATAPADAKLLTDYLEHSLGGRSSDLYWHQWSIAHPPLAAALWPEVQKLAQRELYLLLPELFRLAQQATSAESLSQQIDAFVASSYADVIRDLHASGQTELAETFRQEAMSDYPDDPRWGQLP